MHRSSSCRRSECRGGGTFTGSRVVLDVVKWNVGGVAVTFWSPPFGDCRQKVILDLVRSPIPERL